MSLSIDFTFLKLEISERIVKSLIVQDREQGKNWQILGIHSCTYFFFLNLVEAVYLVRDSVSTLAASLKKLQTLMSDVHLPE